MSQTFKVGDRVTVPEHVSTDSTRLPGTVDLADTAADRYRVDIDGTSFRLVFTGAELQAVSP